METTPVGHAPTSRVRRNRDLTQVGARLLDRITAPAAAPRLPPVRYSVPLVTYVAGLWVVDLVIAAVVVGRSGDWLTASLGSLIVAAASIFSVPALGGMYARWSVSSFFHLAFVFAVGPPAVVMLAIGAGLGNALRRRPGTFRVVFNIANHFLTNLLIWVTFQAVVGATLRGPRVVVGGAVAGVTALLVSYSLIGIVLRLSTENFRLRSWAGELVNLGPYYIGFGVAASGASILYQFDGPLGLISPIVPIVLVQISLVVLSRRVHAHNEANAAHAREREALLQRAVDASEVERTRIAADLHDGVVQDLAALTYACSAVIMDTDDMSDREHMMADRLKEAADTTRIAMRELRTLMIELAPPRLHEDGLESALSELLSKLERSGITTHLTCSADITLEDRPLRLIYRVVQEALRNILKHAECDNVWVTIETDIDHIHAEVKDDGRGFSSADRIRRQGLGHNGLGMLQQTVADGGAELTITSVPGEGTALTLRVPLAAEVKQ